MTTHNFEEAGTKALSDLLAMPIKELVNEVNKNKDAPLSLAIIELAGAGISKDRKCHDCLSHDTFETHAIDEYTYKDIKYHVRIDYTVCRNCDRTWIPVYQIRANEKRLVVKQGEIKQGEILTKSLSLMEEHFNVVSKDEFIRDYLKFEKFIGMACEEMIDRINGEKQIVSR
ncbi:MAG: hypothetical protein QM504_08125 [Pseudomonadota bacterium]